MFLKPILITDTRRLFFSYLAAPAGVENDNSDKTYERFNAERQDWNPLSPEEKGANPWGHWRVVSAGLSADERSISDLKSTPGMVLRLNTDGSVLMIIRLSATMMSTIWRLLLVSVAQTALK